MSHLVTWSLFVALLCACGDDGAGPGADAMAGSGGSGGASGADDPLDPGPGLGTRYFAEGSDDASYLFDDTELRSYELELDPAALEVLDADPSAEMYVEGTLRFEGTELSPVGIRYKGSIGAWVGCVENMNWLMPSGRKTCDKLSMKVKVDWPSDEQRLYGLKRLQFHSMNNDDSMMRERLGYKMFRELGVPAPRAVHARLSINGEYQGVFALVEQIDGRFARSRFDDGNGNLYKEVWPVNAQGTPVSAAALAAALETNAAELAAGTVNTERMQRFGRAVAEAAPEDRLQVISDWMDVDLSMRYVAVDRGLLNDDGIYHWYCGQMGCAPHNFFWYEERTQDRVYLVPWDLDIAMQLMNPVTTLYTDWNETTHGCAAYQSPAQVPIPLRDAACDPILGSFTELEDRFLEHSEALLDGPFAQAAVEEDIDRWFAQIRDAVAEAASSRPGAVSVREVEAGISALKTDLGEMRRRIAARLGR